MTYKKIFPVMAAVLVLLNTAPAQAFIKNTRVTPAVKTLVPNKATSVRAVWTIWGEGPNETIETDDGEWLIGNVAQDYVPALPAQTKTSGTAGPLQFVFTETLDVPLTLVQEAQRQNKPLVFRRVFTSDNFGNEYINVDIKFVFTGGIGGPLEISRLRLAFDNGAPMCNAKPGDDITVTAYVDTEGTGLLRGNWQVRPQGTGGNFRTLRTVQVPVQGGRNIQLKSPPIPTNGSGRVDVRFDVTDPVLAFNEPVVTCAVSGTEGPLSPRMAVGTPATLVTPAPFMPLNSDTLISWQSVSGAKAYRIEVLAKEGGTPVAAQQVKADALNAKLSPLVLDKLDAKRRYLVQVYAE